MIDTRAQLIRFLNPLLNRIQMMLARAVIKTVNDDKKVQQMCLSLLAGEVQDGVERFQNYGYTSHPLPGMEAFVGFIGGDRSNPVIMAVGDRKFRVKGLKQGEVAIYTDEGDTIVFKRGNQIEVTTKTLVVKASEKITYETPEMVINAKTMTVNATDSVTYNTDKMAVNAATLIDISTGVLQAKATAVGINSPATTIAGGLIVTNGLAFGGGATGLDGTSAKINANLVVDGIVTAIDNISSGKSGKGHTHTAPKDGGQTTPPL